MGFKADTSFLRFLSMGAAGARQTMSQMKATGFEPIELERYCTSNKIWTTKSKGYASPICYACEPAPAWRYAQNPI